MESVSSRLVSCNNKGLFHTPAIQIHTPLMGSMMLISNIGDVDFKGPFLDRSMDDIVRWLQTK